MGLFRPGRKQLAQMAQEVAQMERQAHADKIARHTNPPERALDASVDWLVFDGGFLPVLNGALQHSGDLGVLFCAPSVPGDATLTVWVQSMTPNVSVFMDGKALRAALEDGWMDSAMKTRQPLADVQRRLAPGQVLFHYHFDLHPSKVSKADIECFNVAWVNFLESNTWDEFRRALHAGRLPGAPAWWRNAPLA